MKGPEPRFRDGIRPGDRSCLLFLRFPGARPGEPPRRCRTRDGRRHDRCRDAAGASGPIASEHILRLRDPRPSPSVASLLPLSGGPDRGPDPSNIPVGRPSRFAFVEADRTFRVVEASSGEKGPFRTLARGRLDPEQTLTITLHDQDQAVGRLSLEDYAAQADTTPSPTAGWGVPVNAIEFQPRGRTRRPRPRRSS